MKKLKKIIQGLEDTMSAISFAEEGEFNTARDMARGMKKVLLAVREGQMEAKTFRYAINTCKRVGAALDILYVTQTGTVHPVLKQAMQEMQTEGIEFRLVTEKGCLKQHIIDYTTEKKNVLFAVTESSEHLDVDCKGKGSRLSNAWERLKCPLVIVTETI